jgi:GNAT superfamily N-acetyltransferase
MLLVTPTTDALWQSYLDCRYRNLYEPFNLPRTCTTSELDSPRDRPEVLHRMVIIDNQVAAVGRLDLQPAHQRGPSSQLRYCAVDPAHRGRGAGQFLLVALERESIDRNLPRLWMEARVAALNFYLRQGYTDIGEGPLKWGLIPHRILEKNLA